MTSKINNACDINSKKLLSKENFEPDHWVSRDPLLLPLAGRHPFNAEVPTSLLVEKGLITPSNLHYVRNHGGVPKLDSKTHKLNISGLICNPKSLSMDELMKLPFLKFTATISCDGNRRKELNMIQSSRGLKWGTGVIGTSVWKGPLLCEILNECGIKFSEGAKFVCFEGSDEIVNGCYGTNLPLSVVLNPENQIIVAYEMNGEPIPPDHGYPIRLVVPGFVGGRSVKWLKNVIVSDKESDNYYHLNDHRFFLTSVSKPTEENQLKEMNLNSVISHPVHQEWIPLNSSPLNKLTVKGYAYSGGGRQITRVELSLDNGRSWRHTNLSKLSSDKILESNHTSLFKFHKNWIWCFWNLEVEILDLLTCSEFLTVRAWDESFNTQPENPTWNLLGVMNNSWYRVKVEVLKNSNPPGISFLHPILPGDLGGGWMERGNEAPKLLTNGLFQNQLKHTFTREEVAKHNTQDDCWVIIDGEVFDLTYYLKEHPGGCDPILVNAGTDATRAFHAIHSKDSVNMKEMLCIGTIMNSTLPRDKGDDINALNPKIWKDIILTKVEKISPDTKRFWFQFHEKVSLPIGQHILLAAKIKGHFITRSYTPVSPTSRKEGENGIIELVIKIYFSKENQPGGLMSQYLNSLKIGDSIKIKGPAGHLFYHGSGSFTISALSIKVRRVSMIAGGTGITPIFQLIKYILNAKEEEEEEEDLVEISPLYSNHTEEDILLRSELDEIAKKFPNHFYLWYTISKSNNPNWKYSLGRVNERMLREHVFSPDPVTCCFLCGPPGMIEYGCIPNLKKLGYRGENIFEF